MQGDTTTTMAAGLAAHYARVPLVHVEAGLRTHDRWTPFPEEMNRRLTSQLASLHLAPTATARAALLREGVEPDSVVVTGNTVIDALLWTVDQHPAYGDAALETLDASGRPVLLVTAHRRESWGEPLHAHRRGGGPAGPRAPRPRRGRADAPQPGGARGARAGPRRAGQRAAHRAAALRPVRPADGAARRSCSPTPAGCRRRARRWAGRCWSCGRRTERPEAVEAGVARLVGTDTEAIVAAVSELLEDPAAYAAMAQAVNPYGDGRAAWRTERAIARFLGVSDEPVAEFSPAD